MIGLGIGLVRQAVRNASGQAWTPAALFANGEQGVWYEPKPEYLYQDAAGTIPVTADGDPVGYMQDLSGNGNHATQSTSAARPTYRTDGTLHWLEFDGVDDYLEFDGFLITDGLWGAASATKDTPHNGTIFGMSRFLQWDINDTWAALQFLDTGQTRFAAVNLSLDRTALLDDGPLPDVLESEMDKTNLFHRSQSGESKTLFSFSSLDLSEQGSIGALNGIEVRFLDGNIFGVIIIDRPLTGSGDDRSDAKNYLANLAGVTL